MYRIASVVSASPLDVKGTRAARPQQRDTQGGSQASSKGASMDKSSVLVITKDTFSNLVSDLDLEAVKPREWHV